MNPTRFLSVFVLLLAAICVPAALPVHASDKDGRESGFVTTADNIRIHYIAAGTAAVAGSSPTILFIPGWTMPAWIWQKQIDEFSKRYHVIAVDPRSQGESDKPPFGHLPETRARDYKELVDHLDLKRPVLVGWSMACGELVKYAEQFGTDIYVRATSDRWVSHLDPANRPNVVIEAVGHQVATLSHAIEAAAPGGTVFYFGVPDDDSYPISMRTMLRHNLTLKSGVALERPRVLELANKFAAEHPGLLAKYLTHTFGIDDVQAAFELAARPVPDRGKIAITDSGAP